MQENKRRMIQNYLEGYNKFNVEEMLQDLHPEVVFENCSGEDITHRTKGLEAFRQQAETGISYFRERKQDPTSWSFHENAVTVSIDYRATLAMDFPNGMKTGDQLELQGESEFEFRDGKIVRITDRS